MVNTISESHSNASQMRSTKVGGKWIDGRHGRVFEDPATEREMRVAVGIAEQLRRNRHHEDVDARGHKPRHRGLNVGDPFRSTNGLLGHPGALNDWGTLRGAALQKP